MNRPKAKKPLVAWTFNSPPPRSFRESFVVFVSFVVKTFLTEILLGNPCKSRPNRLFRRPITHARRLGEGRGSPRRPFRSGPLSQKRGFCLAEVQPEEGY